MALTETQLTSSYESLIKFARTRMSRDQMDDVEDVVSEAMLKAWKYRESFQGQSAVLTWLYTIVGNSVNDYLNSKRRREPLSAQIAMENPEDDYKFQIIDTDCTNEIAAAQERAKLSASKQSVLDMTVSRRGDFAARDRKIGLPKGTTERRYLKARALVTMALGA